MVDKTAPKSFALPPVAVGLLIGATGWFLLKQLAPILRPLLLAVFLCYVIVPGYHKLRRRLKGRSALLMIAAGTLFVVYFLAVIIQDNIASLEAELPRLTERATKIFAEFRALISEQLPWLLAAPEEAARVDAERLTRIKNVLAGSLNIAANIFLEAAVVGIYLLFLLLEVGRLPQRLRDAFPSESGAQILDVAQRINDSIASFLRVKVRASLFLAVPITIVLWMMGVSFPVLWGLLNFFVNFIPYLGSIVGFSVPVIFTFLDLDLGWRPVAAASLVLAVHLIMAYIVEPRMTGKAVGLSPLVILISLSFWGLCWGFIGMLLAIPLTVVAKIVLDHIPYTSPFAKLLGDE
jgi:AI-2 transport protein TqsA